MKDKQSLPPGGEKYFIYVGNAYPHKNLNRLIEAMVLLNKEVETEVSLIIVSSRNIFTQRIKKSIDSLNADKIITLLSSVSDNQLVGLYRKSVGFVFPSFSEGFGLPGIEAMREGTLVLASDIPVFKEIYKDNAIYFNPLDFSSIEKTMLNVLKMDANLRAEKIEKGKDFVKRYSWTKMAEETLRIYASCNSLRPGK